jgi:hypothetical protein
MRKYLMLALLFASLFLVRAAHAVSGYCGDDICGPGEDCSSCPWDCGFCPGGSGGGVVPQQTAQNSVSIWDGGTGYHSCPLSYVSHTVSGGYNTSVRFRIVNPYTTPTGAFRLTFSSALGWFAPKNLTFAFPPDGYASDGSPYWDVPPLGPNESTEISFTAKGSVGLFNMINVNAQPLDRWGVGCDYFVPHSGANLEQNISRYLGYLNQSQGVTVYYESGGMVLAHLERYGSFAVFMVKGSNVTPVQDPGAINSLVAGYAAAASPTSSVDTSAPYRTLEYSKVLKQGAENNCIALMGMDKYPCVNRTTCRYACASVQVCWYVGQTGWPFIDSMLDYKNSVDSTNAALDKALSSSSAFSQDPSYDNAESALSDMEGLNRNETAVIYQPIFTQYNLCPPPEYAIPQMIGARRQLLDYISSNCIQTKVNRMVDESEATAPLLKLAEQVAAANAAAKAAAEALAKMAANASVCGNGSTIIVANVTLNGSVNTSVCWNATAANQSALNATMNGTAGAKGNATGNITAGVNTSAKNSTAIAQNGSTTNVTVTVPLPGALAKIKDYCPAAPAVILSVFLASAFLSLKRRKR